MLIVSSFHDYYDTSMAWGIDKDCVYSRDVAEIHFHGSNDLPYEKELNLPHGVKLKIIPMIIGFCGQMYPTIKCEYTGDIRLKDEFFFRYEDFESFAGQRGYLEMKTKYFWYRDHIISQAGAKRFFENKFESYQKYFREYHAPVFLIEKSNKPGRVNIKLTINPSLRQLQFVKHKDPFTAFQEIFMFLSGVLGNKEKSTVQISDKDMLKQKGFDQYSFKTGKGEKKPRAKNRGKNE